jgi:putative ABC transport system ATP-binding protein
MIRLSDLSFSYGENDFSLRVPDLCVERGEAIAIVGPSGSGKTTLLRLIAGIEVPGEGRVEVGGAAVSEMGEAERRAFRVGQVGLVFQDFELLEYLDALDNILLPYRIHPSLRLDRDTRERAIALARRLGIGGKLGRLPRHLSQGERQRVAVGRALVTRPPLVLADEPTGNLDPANKLRVLEVLFELSQEQDATLVTVTHDHDLLPRFGRVLDCRSPDGSFTTVEERAA